MEQGREVDGRALRRLRRHRWLTQAELALAAGVHEVTVYKIEAGKVPCPHRSTVVALAKALGVDPELILKPVSDDGGDKPLDIVLRESQRQRELKAISSPNSPHTGRYGAAWDYLGDDEVGVATDEDVIHHAG